MLARIALSTLALSMLLLGAFPARAAPSLTGPATAEIGAVITVNVTGNASARDS